jgi:hypothetical protein
MLSKQLSDCSMEHVRMLPAQENVHDDRTRTDSNSVNQYFDDSQCS